MKFFISF